MRYSLKWPQYAEQWNAMTIKANRVVEFYRYASHILGNKVRYQTIERLSGVPWELVGVLHLRESNLNWGTYLGNGQSLARKTTIVPKGRGPFNSFEDGAVDALKIDGLTDVRDWRLEKMLFYAEAFNGGGYDSRRLPSPYLWGGSSVQVAGKYVADGRFDPKAWDTQPGVAPVLYTLFGMDSTIPVVRES
jgi:lysozyme family protein